MSKTSRVQIGYGSDTRGSKKKGMYGKVSSGKYKANGGFSGEPTVDFTNVSNDRWAEIFGTENLPKWKRELLEAGESLD